MEGEILNDPKTPTDWLKIDGIDGLIELALNLHWSWNHGADELWEGLDKELWATTQNPWDVIDLTSKMHPDGTLDWTPPAGHWVVLRFGYSLLGITNHPATAEATGLEVDKLDRRFVKDYFEKYQ